MVVGDGCVQVHPLHKDAMKPQMAQMKRRMRKQVKT